MQATDRHSVSPSIDAALSWAQSKIGIREDPPGSRCGPEIDEWQRAYGLIGHPWCGAFVGAALRAGGLKPPPEVVWTPALLEWARNGHHGFSFWHWSQRAAGDLVLFSFAESERVDHVGLLDRDRIHTIEGNTTAEGSTAQTAGGVVARRARRAADVVGCARPPWP